MQPEEEGKGNKRKLIHKQLKVVHLSSNVLMHETTNMVDVVWIGHSALNTNVFPTLFPRLQNVLEDFRDMDATALEETKATVRT